MSDGENNHEQEHDHGHDHGSRREAWRARRRGALAFIVAIAVLILVGDILSAITLGRTSSSSARSTVSVTGTGTATGTPNTLNFQIGVSSVAKNASNALAANNARVAALEAALIKSGITKRNMQTSGLNIYQNTNNNGVVTGYTAQDELNVTLHEISKAGAALDAATNAAGNGVQLSNLSYSISNQDALYQKARTAAMKNAYAEAKDIATSAGESVGSIVRVTDEESTSGSTTPTPLQFNAAAGKATSSVPVEAGTETVTDQVSVVYALNG
ncbi:MAG: SIMPL domain-containing protein [Acidimicrobiales bacterium]